MAVATTNIMTPRGSAIAPIRVVTASSSMRASIASSFQRGPTCAYPIVVNSLGVRNSAAHYRRVVRAGGAVRDRWWVPGMGLDAREQTASLGARRRSDIGRIWSGGRPATHNRVWSHLRGVRWVFIALALVWGMVLDGFRPDRYDVLGALICVVGVVVMVAPPRG